MQRRERRLATIAAAERRLEEHARVEAEAERQRRAEAEAERQRTGHKRRGKEPGPIRELPDKAQTSFTAPELKVMPQSNKGWDYSGNAQVSVDATCQIIVAAFVTAAANDQQQALPLAQATLEDLDRAEVTRPVDEVGQPRKIPATKDCGFFSEMAVDQLEELRLDPYMATERHKHHEAAAASEPEGATAKERMAAKVGTPAGRALYARRKVIVEPVYGQIKGARGFRRFSVRGLGKINGEWQLVCLTHNLLKIWRYGCAPGRN